MAKLKTSPFDVADYLNTPKLRARYLEVTIEENDGDPYYVMNALNTIARSVGMAHVAQKSGLSRESLYKTLSGTRNPGFTTITKILTALGLQLHIVARP